ncbi:MAG: hypothetical protein MUE34_07740 [Acidimicrobiales bacterium]|jgi:hypothetical protein|nr:hypothetical protein [Acidimicrobiales bacterium]
MAETRDTVEVDGFAIISGRESVGLPATWSTDTLMARYLDLVRIVRGSRSVTGFRDGDIAELARVTGLDPVAVRHRLEGLADAVRS